MLEYTNGDGFRLQARTGRAFDNNSEPLDINGTVFTGFAATQGSTSVSFAIHCVMNYRFVIIQHV